MASKLLDKAYPVESTYSGTAVHATISGYGSEWLESSEDLINVVKSGVENVLSQRGLPLLHLNIYEEQETFMGWTIPVSKYSIEVDYGTNSYGMPIEQRGLIFGVDDTLAAILATLVIAIVGGVMVAALISVTIGYFTYEVSHGGQQVRDAIAKVEDGINKAIENGAKTIQYVAIGAVALGGILLLSQVLRDYQPEIKSRLSKSKAVTL